jgi:hypothetical protein
MQIYNLDFGKVVGLFDGVYCHFQQYFSYIVAVSFIGGGLIDRFLVF